MIYDLCMAFCVDIYLSCLFQLNGERRPCKVKCQEKPGFIFFWLTSTRGNTMLLEVLQKTGVKHVNVSSELH